MQEQDFAFSLPFAEAMLGKINEDRGIYVLNLDEIHFHLNVMVINKIPANGPQLNPGSITKDLRTAKK